MTLPTAAAQNENIWGGGGRASLECTTLALRRALFLQALIHLRFSPFHMCLSPLPLISHVIHVDYPEAVQIPPKRSYAFLYPCSRRANRKRRTKTTAVTWITSAPAFHQRLPAVPLSLVLAPRWLRTSAAENPPALCCVPAASSPAQLLSASLESRRNKRH